MAAAVLIALANAILYSLIGNNTFTNLFDFHLDPWSLSVMYVLCAIFGGLLVAGGLIGFAEKILRETFFARYGLMVLAICIGGAVLAILLTTVTFLFDEAAYVPRGTSETAYTLLLVTLPGATLGAIEGVILAFPLAWLLGLLGERN
jgi:TRAP-type C4-dicarboxylate transport system permease small subunit